MDNKRKIFTFKSSTVIFFLIIAFFPVTKGQALLAEFESIDLDNSIIELAAGHHYLPLVLSRATSLSKKTQRVNAPFFSGQIVYEETAIFWFGEVTPTDNYSDVRIGFSEEQLFVHVAIFDRLLWYDSSPTSENLADWDAATLYLDKDENGGVDPSSKTFRFVGQLSRNLDSSERTEYQAAYQGNGSGWSKVNLAFTTKSAPRGSPNNTERDSGWWITYQIPFSSLGLTGSPAQGDIWKLGVEVHDRDDASGTPMADKKWPDGMESNRSRSWGQLAFGLPVQAPTLSQPDGSVTIRQGLSGAKVVDGEVGGHTNCGEAMDRFSEWGEANYAHIDRINVQNQYDVSDFPCFSKFFITFPLDNVPQGKVIAEANLTLYQFGNAGGGEWGTAPSSLIQVFTVAGDWKEETITWNNAPQADENISRSVAPWLSSYPGAEGIPRTWDVTIAVSEAYLIGKPVQLALYSGDSERHSGKYFWSSEFDLEKSRPSLQVSWNDS